MGSKKGRTQCEKKTGTTTSIVSWYIIHAKIRRTLNSDSDHTNKDHKAAMTTSSLLQKTLKSLLNPNPNPNLIPLLTRCFISTATLQTPSPTTSDDPSSSSFTFENPSTTDAAAADDKIFLKPASSTSTSQTRSSSSVTMPPSFISGPIVGKRFYKKVTVRESDDGIGWSVMLDYRTLKTPSKRPLKLPTLYLAKAIAAEWEYQQTDGIRPFTMPLMKLACTALERVPLTRSKIIEHLMKKFNQDLVFCRTPKDDSWTSEVHDKQVEKIDPLLDWLNSEFGFKPILYSSFFGGKQEDGLIKAMENLLKKADDYELAAIDAIAAAAYSLTIAVGLVHGRLQIEEAIKLSRLEEDLQVDRWGLVEGGHDVDIADLRVQISAAVVFFGLSRRI